jgi:GNAT superfamily N-acetyltransferase
LTVTPTDRVAGTIKVERLTDTDGKICAEFGLFSVDPSLQSRGIGRRLLNAAEGSARVVSVSLTPYQIEIPSAAGAEYAIKDWGAKKGVMWLLDVRDDLYKW